MHLRRLDLNLLVALNALLEEQSTIGASHRLNIGQSATSAALGRLRQHFGDELLTQVGRRMLPTPLGESLIEPVRDILRRIEATLDAKADFDPATSTRHFKLMMSDYLCAVFFNRVIEKVAKIAPKVTWDIVSFKPPPAEALNSADIDFLVMASSTRGEKLESHHLSKLHPYEKLFEDSYSCLVWSENPLIGETLTLDEFFELGHVVAKMTQVHIPLIEENYFEKTYQKRKIEVFAPNLGSMAHFLIGTNRVATVHTRLARLYASYLPLRVIPHPAEMPTIIESMQWHSYRNEDLSIIWLRSIMKEVASEMPRHAG